MYVDCSSFGETTTLCQIKLIDCLTVGRKVQGMGANQFGIGIGINISVEQKWDLFSVNTNSYLLLCYIIQIYKIECSQLF